MGYPIGSFAAGETATHVVGEGRNLPIPVRCSGREPRIQVIREARLKLIARRPHDNRVRVGKHRSGGVIPGGLGAAPRLLADLVAQHVVAKGGGYASRVGHRIGIHGGAGQVAPGSIAGGGVTDIVVPHGKRADALYGSSVIRHRGMGNDFAGAVLHLDVCGQTEDMVAQRSVGANGLTQHRPGSAGAEIGLSFVGNAAGAGEGLGRASGDRYRRVVILHRHVRNGVILQSRLDARRPRVFPCGIASIGNPILRFRQIAGPSHVAGQQEHVRRPGRGRRAGRRWIGRARHRELIAGHQNLRR